MKFTSKLLSLFTVTSLVFALPTEDSCTISINEYNEKCMFTEFKKENINEICAKFTSDECQNPLNNGIKVLNGCENGSFNIFVDSLKLFNISLKLICEKDEKDEMCPLASIGLSDDNTVNQLIINSYVIQKQDSQTGNLIISPTLEYEEEFLKALKDTCQSEKCKVATKEYYENLTEPYMNMLKLFNKISKDNEKNIEEISKNMKNNFDVIIKSIEKGDCIVNKEDINLDIKLNTTQLNASIHSSDAKINKLNTSLLLIIGSLILFLF
ncbi:hypothetical protein BCR32DRAFT_330632 [Anaeromyces robustus]|uniref:Uncharacterized protein n=1 Tax=Anaeromyces robustus TaxID=1754192 RepID=A0A1Y1VSS9_9FUNG|nr:hypothetical protein BCR32DRAFT_330632 [Anaeromyces robustus]|eukprot:ORX64350.1 hypothetical protein BCR32DRAFT_330632 [Anaeromyces robustus]